MPGWEGSRPRARMSPASRPGEAPQEEDRVVAGVADEKQEGAVGAKLDRLRRRGPGGIGDHGRRRGGFRPLLVDDDQSFMEDARHREPLGFRHPGEVRRADFEQIDQTEGFEMAHRVEAVVEAEARQPEIDLDPLPPPAPGEERLGRELLLDCCESIWRFRQHHHHLELLSSVGDGEQLKTVEPGMVVAATPVHEGDLGRGAVGAVEGLRGGGGDVELLRPVSLEEDGTGQAQPCQFAHRTGRKERADPPLRARGHPGIDPLPLLLGPVLEIGLLKAGAKPLGKRRAEALVPGEAGLAPQGIGGGEGVGAVGSSVKPAEIAGGKEGFGVGREMEHRHELLERRPAGAGRRHRQGRMNGEGGEEQVFMVGAELAIEINGEPVRAGGHGVERVGPGGDWRRQSGASRPGDARGGRVRGGRGGSNV